MDDSTTVFISILVIYILLLASLFEGFLPCSIRDIISSGNILYIYFSLYLFIFVSVTEVISPELGFKEQIKQTFMLIFIFTLLSHVNVKMFFIILILFYCAYLFRKNIDEEKVPQKEFYHKLFLNFIYAVIVLSFLEYLGGKSNEYGKNFTWAKFFGPQQHCEGTLSTQFSLKNIQTGISRVLS